jgi:hypothetical protein
VALFALEAARPPDRRNGPRLPGHSASWNQWHQFDARLAESPRSIPVPAPKAQAGGHHSYLGGTGSPTADGSAPEAVSLRAGAILAPIARVLSGPSSLG